MNTLKSIHANSEFTTALKPIIFAIKTIGQELFDNFSHIRDKESWQNKKGLFDSEFYQSEHLGNCSGKIIGIDPLTLPPISELKSKLLTKNIRKLIVEEILYQTDKKLDLKKQKTLEALKNKFKISLEQESETKELELNDYILLNDPFRSFSDEARLKTQVANFQKFNLQNHHKRTRELSAQFTQKLDEICDKIWNLTQNFIKNIPDNQKTETIDHIMTKFTNPQPEDHKSEEFTLDQLISDAQ